MFVENRIDNVSQLFKIIRKNGKVSYLFVNCMYN